MSLVEKSNAEKCLAFVFFRSPPVPPRVDRGIGP
jgi:hypothetical protein